MAAREVRKLFALDARCLPWKNGRGTTREFALGPPGSSFERADFDWRISAARVEESGRFSDFAGFDRTLVITEGEGLILEHGSAALRARLRRMEPYRFSGDWPTRCELIRGGVSDFNVLARRGRCSAEVLALELGTRVLREPLAAQSVFLHALNGACVARISGEEEALSMDASDSLTILEPSNGDEIELRGSSEDSSVVLVLLHSPRAGVGQS